jgi:hypothetical protein
LRTQLESAQEELAPKKEAAVGLQVRWFLCIHLLCLLDFVSFFK